MPEQSIREPSHLWHVSTGGGLGLLLMVFGLASLAGWLIPVEEAQLWAIKQVPADNVFAQFEAAGKAEAVWWLLAYLCPVLLCITMWSWRQRQHMTQVFLLSWQEFLQLTSEHNQSIRYAKTRTLVKRVALMSAILLAVAHAGSGLWRRIEDWPYYRLNSGEVVLPNISESNRDIIRYLQAVTPEDARIFVASDQKLYFLSYYLWPRKLFHHVHPESAHLIPRANQARQLAAYRLEEMPDELIRFSKPDYTLEYFEGPEYIDESRNAEDKLWLEFHRRRQQNNSYVPPYTLVLKAYQSVGTE